MNELRELLFPERAVRGAYVDLREGIDDMLGWRDYSPDVFKVIGEALAAAALIASHLKFDGRINLQYQGKGDSPLTMLVTQIDNHLQVRGMAKTQLGATGSFRELVGDGMLALMLEPAQGTQYYQALVDVRGDTLAESLEGYFTQSEQIETFIRLAASKDRLCGLLLQRLPPREGHDDDANWEHLRILASTLGEREMLEVDGETLLHRLFHEDDRRMFEPREVKLQCRCSHAGISAMLLGLGEQELAPVLLERGKVEVICEFCGREYSYSDIEVRALFAAEHAGPEHQTRQ